MTLSLHSDLTVVEVLAEAGWPTGRHGRTQCPLHRGKNDQAFSYKRELWSCWSCGAKGNALTLARELGLVVERPEQRPPTIAGIDATAFRTSGIGQPPSLRPRVDPERPTARLDGWLEARRQQGLAYWAQEHREAEDDLRDGARALRVLGEEAFEWAGLIVPAALARRDAACARLQCEPWCRGD